MKSIYKKILKILAKQIIFKYKPKVIAVTGSVGKTSTKDAIYEALKLNVDSIRKSQGNLNTEWGLPLTIIGKTTPKNLFDWFGVMAKAISLLIFNHKFPKYMVLEMGADRPGDISYLLEIAKPSVAVLTEISHTHLENFGSVDEIAKEKLKLIEALPEDGVAVFNGDSELIAKFISKPSVRYLTYGTKSGVEVAANDIAIELFDLAIEKTTASDDKHIGGLGFNITYQNSNYQAYLINLIGRGHVYAALAAISVVIGLDLDLEKAIEGLKKYRGENGRMHLLKGIKHSFIIDDTYNSSPEAAELALETLSSFDCQGKKWAVLGDMLELGGQSQELHERIGSRVAELKIDYLVTKGLQARYIASAAEKAGFEVVFSFDDNESAGKFVQQEMKEGDLILIKGSRGMKMEEITKEIMAEPLRAKELLVH